VIVGLVVTATLVLVSHAQYTSNEKRLLRLRVRDAAALVAGSLPGIQITLASAAELADATNGDIGRFMRFAAAYVGTGQGQFASLSLWKLSSPQRGPVAVVGLPPKLARSRSSAAAFLTAVARRPQLNVIGLLGPPDSRLGFAYTAPGVAGGYAAYAENRLPANRRSALQSSNQFAGLHYAIYLGADQRRLSNLLVTDVARPPLPGARDAVAVPFGDTVLTLAMSSQRSLAGSLPRRLPWIIAIVGALLTLVAAAVARLLVRRRRDAEGLAGENQRLYAEQRGIAQTLQHSLLPDKLPQIPGVETSGRYEAGEQGVDIGGDWYDVIDLGGDRLLVVVGDVAGRGLPAATMMARLRYAIQAYAPDYENPAAILTRLSRMVSLADGAQLATVLCALVDIGRREISVASAGHLPPLLIDDGDGHYLKSQPGLPIGVEADSPYTSTRVSMPRSATLLAFTDGLVERRGEPLGESLGRLRQAAVGRDLALSELLSALVNEMQSGAGRDDIAIVGLRWTR
jgi:serine phosphatase RsbU (regulator of sigma subunit)